MSAALVACYAAGWILSVPAIIVIGVRSRSLGTLGLAAMTLVGATVWPLVTAGVVQWALIAAFIEITRAARRRPATLPPSPAAETADVQRELCPVV